MKNLCIVTVYNSINSGSYWQAKALGEFLGKNNNVIYLKRSDIDASSHPIKKIRRVVRYLVKLNLKGAIREYKTIKRFSKLEKNFPTIQTEDEAMTDIDCVVLGSDTIWNLDDKYFSKNYRKYFGGIFQNKKIITYAPSAANTSIAKFKEKPEIIDMLKNMSNISTRDQKTAEIVKHLTEITPTIVCDPTMLLTKEEYLTHAKKRLIKEKFIFLYLFRTLTESQIQQLRQFANNNNLKIVSGARYLNFADECFVNAPDLFLQNMVDAEYVITDTFHGTLFSAILNKNFAVIDRNKEKVIDLLNQLHLKERIVEDDEIVTKLQNVIGYKKTNKAISKLRETSINYLKNAIK